MSKKNECEYCGNECIGINTKNNRKELGIELHSGNGTLVAYGLDKQGWNISVTCKISYCPMCGKKIS